jgi:hypothetical protein
MLAVALILLILAIATVVPVCLVLRTMPRRT